MPRSGQQPSRRQRFALDKQHCDTYKIFIKNVSASLAISAVPRLLRECNALEYKNIYPHSQNTTFMAKFATEREAVDAQQQLNGKKIENIILQVEMYQKDKSVREVYKDPKAEDVQHEQPGKMRNMEGMPKRTLDLREILSYTPTRLSSRNSKKRKERKERKNEEVLKTWGEASREVGVKENSGVDKLEPSPLANLLQQTAKTAEESTGCSDTPVKTVSTQSILSNSTTITQPTITLCSPGILVAVPHSLASPRTLVAIPCAAAQTHHHDITPAKSPSNSSSCRSATRKTSSTLVPTPVHNKPEVRPSSPPTSLPESKAQNTAPTTQEQNTTDVPRLQNVPQTSQPSGRYTPHDIIDTGRRIHELHLHSGCSLCALSQRALLRSKMIRDMEDEKSYQEHIRKQQRTMMEVQSLIEENERLRIETEIIDNTLLRSQE